MQCCQNQLLQMELTVGTACENSACNYCFSDSATDDNQCRFHPGAPIFHESMKYWSCCQRKTSDFTVFMAQPGCKYGQHKLFKDNRVEMKGLQYSDDQQPFDTIPVIT
uniref:CHORD domain-containing protein n=1 Tax=Glossina austeni TaxID=7395 RepID=A0A1A9UJM0_GLOAU